MKIVHWSLILLAVMPALSWSKSLTMVGTLRTHLPEVEISHDGDVDAHVQRLTLRGSPKTTLCIIEAANDTQSNPVRGGVPLCEFSWVYDSNFQVGSEAGLYLDGYFDQVGSQRIGYQLVFYNTTASGIEPVVVNADMVTLQAKEPVKPKFTGFNALIAGAWHQGEQVTNHKRPGDFEALEIQVEPRPWDQLITADTQSQGDQVSCTVPAGSDNCVLVPLSASERIVLGSDVELTGQMQLNVRGDAHNGFWSHEQGARPLQYAWDYRPPSIEAFHPYVRVGDAPPLTLEVGSESVTVENGQAKVLLTSPHYLDADDWWVPKKVALTLTPANDERLMRDLYADGRLLMSYSAIEQSDSLVLQSRGYEVLTDAVVYQLDLSNVPDGLYQVEVAATDDYGNGSTAEFVESALIREHATIKAFVNYRELYPEGHLLFFDDLLVAGHNGFVDGVTIDEVTINGEPLRVAESGPGYLKFSDDGITLGNNQMVDLTITSTDNGGNSKTTVLPISYLPVDYVIRNQGPSPLYSRIQTTQLSVEPEGAVKCNLYPTRSIAEMAANAAGVACHLLWTRVPEGLQPNINALRPSLQGNVATDGDHQASYAIRIINRAGRVKRVEYETLAFTSHQPTPPVISYDQDTQLSSGYFALPTVGGHATRVYGKALSADLEMNIGLGDYSQRTSTNQRHNMEFVTVNGKARNGAGKLWEVVDIPAKVHYELAPEISSEETISVVYVPPNSVRVWMSVDDLYGLTNANTEVVAQVGIYDRREKRWVYDAEEIGLWQIELMSLDPEKNEYSVVPATDVDSDGMVRFDLDPKVLNESGGAVFVRAYLQSEVEGYSRELESNYRYLRVFKGESVEGELSSRNITGQVPYSASVRFTPASRDDSVVMGKVRWQISRDNGATWEDATDYDNRSRVNVSMEQEGKALVRAELHNRYSGAVGYTDNLELIGYTAPDVKIEQVNTAFVGEPLTLAMADANGLATDSNTEYEWSLDGGNNWTPGGRTLTLTEGEVDRYVYGRSRYQGIATDVEDGSSWRQSKARAVWVKPKPPYISIVAPSVVEAETEFEISELVRAPYPGLQDRLRGHWILPDGTTLDPGSHTITISEADAASGEVVITRVAWVEGQEEATKTERARSVTAWAYQFTPPSIVFKEGDRFAPSDVIAYVRTPKTYNPGVTFTSEWLAPTAESITDNGSTVRFSFAEPGVHNIQLVYSDDRGNVSTSNEFVTLLQPDPMAIEITPTYSNPFMRTPLDAVLRVSARLGHPDDRIKHYSWWVDGEQVVTDSPTGYRGYFYELAEGSHEIDVEITTEYGQVERARHTVVVVPNQLPECRFEVKKGSSLNAIYDCHDPDGKVLSYSWYLNGVKLNSSSRSITMSVPSEPITLMASAMDDSGAVVDYSEFLSF